MPQRSTPSSRASKTAERRPASPSQTQGVREWLGSVRFSGFMGVMLLLVVLAAFVLVPTVGTYVAQRQQIAALEETVQLTQQQVHDLEAERERWGDEAYITSQARERLYYVKPGEIVYLIDDDLDDDTVAADKAPVSDEIEERSGEWMMQFVRSLTASGLAKTASP